MPRSTPASPRAGAAPPAAAIGAAALGAALAVLAAAAPAAAPIGAQEPVRPPGQSPAPARDTLDGPSLPDDAAREVTALFNAPGTTRVIGTYELAAGRTIEGDVAVLRGPVTIAGRITGRLTVVNGDVTFRRGARVDGDVFVVGGVVDGRREATLGGELRIQRQPLVYQLDGDRLVAVLDADDEPTRWWRLGGTRTASRRTWAGFNLTTGRTYNRVEGLPIWFGPSVEHRLPWGRLRVDAYGIFRTAGEFRWDSANVGHVARAELRVGPSRAPSVRLGGRLYDEVAAVEEWQLDGAESGVAAFFLHRDYRDHWNRHGGAAYVVLQPGRDASLTASLADERWASRASREPFSIYRNNHPWRPNPQTDEGRLHVADVALRVDTRNNADRPWAGWYVLADYERGTGGVTRFGPTSATLLRPDGAAVDPSVPGARDETPGRRRYGRGFLDLRRYNRLGPDAQLNFRVAAGGWLHGDPLPLQRRLSVTGPGALAGFDFRAPTGRGADVGTCALAGAGAVPAGSPSQCERMVVAQVEYRGDIRVGLFGDDDEPRLRRRGFRTAASWVVFADAGRGWLVRRPGATGVEDARADRLVYDRGALPPLSTFLTDVGVGFDFSHGRRVADLGSFGIYVAKSLSRPDQGANVFLRIRRRF